MKTLNEERKIAEKLKWVYLQKCLISHLLIIKDLQA